MGEERTEKEEKKEMKKRQISKCKKMLSVKTSTILSKSVSLNSQDRASRKIA